MKTTAPARAAAPRPAPQTLTLDMGLPPAPPKPTRKSPILAAPSSAIPSAAPVKPAAAKTALPAKPAAVKAAVPVKPRTAKTDLPMKPARAKAEGAQTKPAVKKAPAMTPAPNLVRVEREMALEGGRLWRMSGRHAVAYVHSAPLACALLSVETKHLARQAMAVYYDKKGRAIAWQVRFDTQHWEEVIRQLG